MTASEDEEDAFLEQFIRKPGDPLPYWAINDPTKLAEELQRHPFFMRELPKEYCESLEAIQALLYDGTPDENAANFKQNGNEAFQRGANADAAIFYSKGIDQQPADKELLASLLLNRAATHLLLSNWGDACIDAMEALKLNDSLAKGYIRLAKGLLALGRSKQALRYILIGLAKEPQNSALIGLQAQAEAAAAADVGLAAVGAVALGERKIQSILSSADWCSSTLEAAATSAQHLQSRLIGGVKVLFIPIVFLYPCYNQYDLIEACDERQSISSFLELVFASQPPWDAAEGLYVDEEGKMQQLSLFYESFDPNWPISNRIKHVDAAKPLASLVERNDFALQDGKCHLLVVPTACMQAHLTQYKLIL